MSDDKFWEWATRLKPCRYCTREFLGPVCPCEQKANARLSEIRRAVEGK